MLRLDLAVDGVRAGVARFAAGDEATT